MTARRRWSYRQKIQKGQSKRILITEKLTAGKRCNKEWRQLNIPHVGVEVVTLNSQQDKTIVMEKTKETEKSKVITIQVQKKVWTNAWCMECLRVVSTHWKWK